MYCRLNLAHSQNAEFATAFAGIPGDYVLNQILPIEQRRNFHHHTALDGTIQPKFAIDEKMLIKIINYLGLTQNLDLFVKFCG